uniref:hypothetical protein n=1 Tax=uncultured Jannaschia sp. TaxID=293347 RepID=UPI002605AFD5
EAGEIVEVQHPGWLSKRRRTINLTIPLLMLQNRSDAPQPADIGEKGGCADRQRASIEQRSAGTVTSPQIRQNKASPKNVVHLGE